ncbi:MAG: prepilin-type N-terminal cleavage/methylation domain-containing protein [Syntrophomonas sp.]|nr:prepilin-type N-terminal cleavage/methylation domain-containing protein [Syntrophomonas sp.]
MVGRGRDRGSTLAEMLVAMALASLVLTGMMSIYWTGSNAFQRLLATADAQYAVRSATQKMGEDIRGASVITILEGGAKLSLLTATGEAVNYYMANNQLYRDGNAKVPIAENISGLNFSGISSLVKITVNGTVDGRAYQLISSISPRLISVVEGDK